MHAALARLQIKPKNQQIYILIQRNSILAFPAAKTRLPPRHMARKNPSYYLKSNPTETISKQHGTKEGKIAAYKKSNKKKIGF